MIPFIDAHVHFWDLERIAYPWLTPPFADDGPNGSVEPIATTYLPDHYRTDLARWNVTGAVHVDAGASPDQALAETRWLDGLAEATGMPSAIVAFAPLDDPDVERLLAAQASHPRVRGIRQIVNWHPDPRRTYTPHDVTHDDRWWAGFGMLGRHGLSFDLQCYPDQMAGLAARIARHADIPVIVNHLGMPVMSDREGLTRWRHGMRTLAAIPHVSVKLSGFGFIRRDWTVDAVRPFVLEAIDLFGTDRCLFASDLPTDKLFASADRCLEACHAIVAAFSEDERRDLFARNSARVYRLASTQPSRGA